MERGQLNGDGQRIGNTTTMDNKEGTRAMAMSMQPTIDAAANDVSEDND